ncbi:hypothetical protein HBI24_074990 [Parastagonospora nodorum]|nr:hypothetical protein HBH96_210570 [Parastagonospora nodorum]KAH5586609.1 hypothetical protein HBI24_074990 [Parastagonospora nodorum]KAH5598939.1 hypothetical protein HBI45_154950 [Parastagonospora nodorum]KAH6295127.1 hypothetical protein HBI39_160530 [Parastagonospora nodorum]
MLVFADSRSQLQAVIGVKSSAITLLSCLSKLLRTVPLYICRSMRFLPNSWQSAALSNQTIPRSLTREW